MPKAVGSPQITLRYRPTDPLGELLNSLPQGADKTAAVNEALRPNMNRVAKVKAHRMEFKSTLKEAVDAVNGGWEPRR